MEQAKRCRQGERQGKKDLKDVGTRKITGKALRRNVKRFACLFFI